MTLRPTELLQSPEFKALFERYQVVHTKSLDTGEGMHGCLADDPEFMIMLDNLMEEVRCDLGTKIYEEIEAGREIGFPNLPEGWAYTYTHGAGGVGAVHEESQITIYATPGYDCDSDLEVPVEVTYPDGDVHYHERWHHGGDNPVQDLHLGVAGSRLMWLPR